MRSLYFLMAASLISLRLLSQDTLYTTGGQVIAGKVYEITTDEIKYRQADNPDGPLYVVPKSSMAQIRYQNGSKEFFSEDPQYVSEEQPADNAGNGPYINPRPVVNVFINVLPFILNVLSACSHAGYSGGGHHAYQGGSAHYGPRSSVHR